MQLRRIAAFFICMMSSVWLVVPIYSEEDGDDLLSMLGGAASPAPTFGAPAPAFGSPAPAFGSSTPTPAFGAPAPAAAKNQVASGEDEPEVVGIDTLGTQEPQGNWLFKRIWWEKAENKYGKLRGTVEEVFESRHAFFEKRNELGRSVLTPFYLAVGLEQGELQELLKYLNSYLKKELEEDKSLSKEERELRDKLPEHKVALEQLHVDVKGINKLEDALNDAITQLMEQINKVRQYEDQAWKTFKDIGRELSDKKAREYYYKMDEMVKNIQAINEYLKGDFSQYFDNVIATVKTHTERIIQLIKDLDAKGLSLKQEQERIDAQERAEELKEQQEREDRLKKEKDEAQKSLSDGQSHQEPATGFFGNLWNNVIHYWNSSINWITSWWSSSVSADVVVEQDMSNKSVEESTEATVSTTPTPESKPVSVTAISAPEAEAAPDADQEVPVSDSK